MRIKINILEKYSSIQINYNYLISSLIYTALSKENKDYAEFLHNSGFGSMNSEGYGCVELAN